MSDSKGRFKSSKICIGYLTRQEKFNILKKRFIHIENDTYMRCFGLNMSFTENGTLYLILIG